MTRTTERFPTGGKPLSIDVFSPDRASRGPAVLILHGTYGMEDPFGPAIHSFAEALVDRGMLVILPSYFASTNTTPGRDVGSHIITTNLATWRQACSDALTFTSRHAETDPTRVGVLGFSLGGHLALSLALQPPAGTSVRCVVDFFGPTDLLEQYGGWSTLPPVLIHHGSDDDLVKYEQSTSLVAKLKAAKKIEGEDYVFESYEGQGHGFTGDALTKSRDTTVRFFEERLARSPVQAT